MKNLKQQLAKAEEELKDLVLRVSVGDKSTETKDAVARLEKLIIDLKTDIEKEKIAVKADRQKKIEAEKQKWQAQVEKESVDVQFNIDYFSDPVTRCMMWTAINDTLQYQDISSQNYLRTVRRQGMRNRGGVAEINEDQVLKEEAQRNKIKEIQIMRCVAYREWEREAADLPAESPYQPRATRLTDEGQRAEIQIRQARNAKERQAAWEEMQQELDELDIAMYGVND